ncbi:MAG: M48 family metallopeptidase [Saprospiraceae bacterium]
MEKRIALQIAGQEVPVRIIREPRNSVRAYMGKQGVIMRFPTSLSEKEFQEHFQRLEDWLRKQLTKKEGVAERYKKADYQTGDTFIIGKRSYGIYITSGPGVSSKAKIINGTIALMLGEQLDEAQRSDAIRTLMSRLMAKEFLPTITERVKVLNERFFKKNIRSVKLKYNHSNWGSCSRSGNINLSTRLLFAPDEVIDYVIIHELAHLVELNHSQRFWDIVARCMPNYEEHEAWLKEYGGKCDF